MKKKNEIKNCAVINDLTGFGRCALNISIPVMSAQGVRVLSAPTAVLSNHTAFDEYYFSDLTDGLSQYFANWDKLGLRYDGIYTGFLGSEHQVDIIDDFIKRSKKSSTFLFVDPVMGDDGELYSTYTPALVAKMRSLIHDADIITPNLTEACLLSDRPYSEMKDADFEKIFSLARELCEKGAKCTVITGIYRNGRVFNFVYDRIKDVRFVCSSKYIAGEFCGTGDLFASLLCGYILQGMPLKKALKKTLRFVCLAVSLSEKKNFSPTDGVAFEPLLKHI